MSMVTLVDEYLTHRRRLGFQLRIDGQQLNSFARFADACGHSGPLTLDLALRWAKASPASTPVGWARRLALVRHFAQYRLAFDPATEVPPQGLLGPLHHPRHPYIYTPDEIQSLLAAALEFEPRNGLRPLALQTLFGLLAATGLRVSEALHLTTADIDLTAGLLTIRNTKFARSRLVPLHSSTTAVLRTYQTRCQGYRQPIPGHHFFITDNGQPLVYRQVLYAFQVIRHRLGWQTSTRRPAPRIHDIRHTFACYRLLNWYRNGIDVDHAITVLSTYLGHQKVSDTYWYLTGIPELMTVIAERFETYTARTERSPS